MNCRDEHRLAGDFINVNHSSADQYSNCNTLNENPFSI